MKKPQTPFDNNVFINCPFDDRYDPLFLAMVFAIHLVGFRVRCSKEVNKGGDRLEKIMHLIRSCKYGIHDISRIQRTNKMPRFNMPFELGIDMAYQSGGNTKCKTKNILIMETHEYRYKQFISDLSGRDISPHYDRVSTVIDIVRDWLNDALRGTKKHPLPAGDLILKEYRKFQRNLRPMCAQLQLERNHMTFSDYHFVVAKFIADRGKKLRQLHKP
jgi:hypothetical protein